MALFYECMPKCARKLLDTADIVRDAMLQQQPTLTRQPSGLVSLLHHYERSFLANALFPWVAGVLCLEDLRCCRRSTYRSARHRAKQHSALQIREEVLEVRDAGQTEARASCPKVAVLHDELPGVGCYPQTAYVARSCPKPFGNGHYLMLFEASASPNVV
jgi:hypothetical protein